MGDHDSPRAVLLDVGGTLIEARPTVPDVYARTLSRWGAPVEPGSVAPIFQEVWAEMTQLHPRGLDRYHHLKGGEWEWWGELLRRVMARLGNPAPWEPVLRELFSAFADPSLWHVFPEVGEALATLRSKGLRLAVVSNWDSRLPALLDGLGLSGFFDEVVISSMEGVEKPATEIFHRAARRLGVPPAACLHAGDSPLDDYRGAESAGMRAVLVDRDGMFGESYVSVSDLRGLYDLVA